MQLEDCFEFEKFDTKFGPVERIRIKGHRISIEHVLDHYKQGLSAETIQKEVYPTLTLAEVYATITYYLYNKEAVDEYNRRGEEVAEAYYQEYLQRGPYFLRDDALAARQAQDEPAAKAVHE